MNNNNETRHAIYYLQKRIVALSREYYQAIKNNITFDQIKLIFLKRKKLKEELSSIKQYEEDLQENYGEENLKNSLY